MAGAKGIGTFVVSFDCEMLWGCHYAGGLAAFPYVRDCRHTYRRLLELLRRYEIPATFAFVGAMALSPQELERRLEPFSPDYRDWTARARAAAGAETAVLFDPSLIEAVARDPVGHEIGAHGFTHRRFTDMPAADARLDFSIAAEALRPYAPEVRSFVFPENRISHLDSLAQGPFALYRRSEPRWYSRAGAAFGPLGHYVDEALALTPPLATVARNETPAAISDSLMLFAFRGVRGMIPAAARRRKALGGVAKAAAQGGLFHFWTHPWELGETPKSFEVMETMFAAVAAARDAGRIEVRTMAQAVFG